MQQLKVAILILSHGLGLEPPQYATPLSAGMDLRAAITAPVILAPGQRALIPTSVCLQFPAGYEAQIRPRSGLALNSGVTVLNSPATIDADYHGELKVILVNNGQEPFEIQRGMRIAQVVIAPVVQAQLIPVSKMPKSTSRHEQSGFGSTGLF